ncbi:DUF4364 family protein [Candidatus Weimeria sp. HCP3S3_B5]|uniref:DUF4364 family protein n=1 Tax=Candidatus Weimeria sp. HCP3S3_B5 TaxID=3438871 RepID=UPI003F897BE8
MAELDLIYEMAELGLISKSADPVRGITIISFMTNYDYCDYFKAVLALETLRKAGLVHDSGHDSFTLTEKGHKTLEGLHDRITPGMEADYKDFYKKNNELNEKKSTIRARYDALSGGRGFIVHLSCKKSRHTLFEINMHVMTKEQAENICMNFKVRYNRTYEAIMDELMN